MSRSQPKSANEKRGFFRSLSRNRDPPGVKKTSSSEKSSEESYVHVSSRPDEDDDEDGPEIYGPPGMLLQERNSEDAQPMIRDSSSCSSTRRLSIHRKAPSIAQYTGTPIEKHYDISKQILSAFDSHFTSNLLVTAYAVGIQFVELALLEIPKHGYFYSIRHQRERMQNSLDAVRVANQLKSLDGLEGFDATRVEKLLSLGLEQVEKASSDQDRSKYQSKRELLEEELRVDDEDWITVQCEPGSLLASCSESFASCSGMGSTADILSPPSLLPDRSESSVGEESLGKALYLSGLEVQPARQTEDVSEKIVETRPPIRASARLELSTLAQLYHEDFDSLQLSGRVRISYADTYQGKMKESTNGCAVIAPLMATRHLQKSTNPSQWNGDPGLPDRVIERCIDVDTPPILGELRGKLGLSEHAFLIPADVHDYLMDNGQLDPKQFLTVTGGNILDEQHLNTFIGELEKVKDRRVAATVFFHEHVVAILKLRRIDPKTSLVSFWYDFIDSLPLKDTLRTTDESASELCSRLGILSGDCTPEDEVEISEMNIIPRTVRIRCLDQEALMAVLRWYACSKFTEENNNYIDQYAWDDVSCDFDPRVFQSFVWGSLDSYHATVTI